MASHFARHLRANLTDAEAALWFQVRRKQIHGFRLRRQQPIGPYIVDFFCPEAALIVEIDGGQHADDSGVRSAWLEARGYRILRFWNNDVLGNMEGVLLVLREALRALPEG